MGSPTVTIPLVSPASDSQSCGEGEINLNDLVPVSGVDLMPVNVCVDSSDIENIERTYQKYKPYVDVLKISARMVSPAFLAAESAANLLKAYQALKK